MPPTAFAATPSRVDLLKITAHDEAGNRAEGTAELDLDAETTAGTFTAQIRDPQPVLDALLGTAAGRRPDDALKAGGSVALTGSWNGPLRDPVLAITADATNVFVAASEFRADGGAIEARLNGPVSSPEGTCASRPLRSGRRRSARARGSGISLTPGRVDVTARVPDWSASLTGHASADAPHAFAATVSISDLTTERLVRLTGGDPSSAIAEGAVSATLDASGSFDRRRVRLTGKASLAGAELGGGESPFVDGLNAAVDIRDGRLWLSSLTARGFRGPVSASAIFRSAGLRSTCPRAGTWRARRRRRSPRHSNCAPSPT